MRTFFTTRNHDAKVDEVVGLLTSPEGAARVGGSEVRTTEVSDVAGGDGLIAVVERQRMLDLRREATRTPLLSTAASVREVARWRMVGDSAIADVETHISGAPLTVSGVHRVIPIPGGCRSEIELEVMCRVPMLGGRLVRAVGGLAATRLEQFLDDVDAALAERPR